MVPVSDLVAAASLGGAALVVLALAELVRKLGGAPELARKTAHVGSGMVVVSFPYLFASAVTVALLATSFVLVITVSHRMGSLKGVHGVERKSLGAFAFPVVVALLFVLARGNPAHYVIPMLVLALADAAAALVGTSYGSVHYHALGERRSLEGSVAFLVVTFIVVHVPLQLYGLAPRADTVLIAAGVALVATAVEAISVRGLDNLFVPVAAWYALDRWLVAPDPDDHWRRLVFLGVAAACALVIRRAHLVTRTAAVGMMLCAYAAWSMGGWPWVTPLLAAFVLAVLLALRGGMSPEREPMGLSHLFGACVTAVLLLFIHDRIPGAALFVPYLVALTCGSTIVASRLARTPSVARPAEPWWAVALATAAPVAAALLVGWPEPDRTVVTSMAIPLVSGPAAVALAGVFARSAAIFHCAACDSTTQEPRHCGQVATLRSGRRYWTHARTGWTAIAIFTLLALALTRL